MRWRDGDRSAGQRLITSHYDAIVRFFRAKVTGPSDELVQATFLACAESLDRFRADSTFRAYLFGIARFKLLEHLRAKARAAKIDPDFGVSCILDCDPGVSTVLAKSTELRQLKLALARLPVDTQTLLELHYWQELSMNELACVFETKPGTIKSRLFKARELLRAEIAKIEAEGDHDGIALIRSTIDAWDLADANQLEALQAGG